MTPPRTVEADVIDYQPARVYFWNKDMGVSPAISGEYPTKEALSNLLWETLQEGAADWPGMSHEHWAAFFCHRAWTAGFMIEVHNAPSAGGDRLGGIISRIQSADQIVGGFGTLLIDPINDELMVYGGGGLDLMEEGTFAPTVIRNYNLLDSLQAVLNPAEIAPVRKKGGKK